MEYCYKCASEDINTKYVKDGELINSSSMQEIDNEFIRSSEYDYFYKLTAKKEHLLKSCRNCGYELRVNTK